LESAREHFNLNPTGHYELLHRNRTIDLSLPFRLTGISNMATIELLVATTSSSSSNTTSGETIRVCIQLPDGKRMQHTFKPQDSLEEILQHFKLLPSPFNVSLFICLTYVT
jgi:tether containing UBX domain for GLUT4